ncbi:MAG: ATP-binding protein [archaeon]
MKERIEKLPPAGEDPFGEILEGNEGEEIEIEEGAEESGESGSENESGEETETGEAKETGAADGKRGKEKEKESEGEKDKRKKKRRGISQTILRKARNAGEESEGKERTGNEKPETGTEERDWEKSLEEIESEAGKESEVPLSFLSDFEHNNVFIGRKKSVFSSYGYEAALFVGKVSEEEHGSDHVYMDSLNPHVVFVCGARGSGKSYVLGVMAEELALKNKNVGIIVVDPIGVFWSMRFPNKEEKEILALAEWDLMPQGTENVKVFIPKGMASDTPKTTYDATYSIQPSLLTAEDWCLTFGMDRFSPSGLLLEKALRKVEIGYADAEGKRFAGKRKAFSLEEIILCLERDSELNSRERGFKQDSIRALASRFESAKNWGIFDEKGTPLAELSRENQLTILDTSFLEENVTALVIGLLARRILAARKISTRKEAAKRLKTESVDQLLELEIPPTWLFIDEAHTLIPSGNVKTPATNGLVEYVKQGRRPGCSLVFATQQPSAIDTRVLSQLDLLIAHKLVFDDDVKAVYKRAPTIIPPQYRRATFIKTLPVGTAIVADRREETSRAFIMQIRPRMSQHEGRDAETADRLEEGMGKEQVERLSFEMIMAKLRREGEIDFDIAEDVVKTLNSKYKAGGEFLKVLAELKKAKVEQNKGKLLLGERKAELELEESGIRETVAPLRAAAGTKAGAGTEKVELLAIPARVSEEGARKIVDSVRKKKVFGLVGKEETVQGLGLRHVTVWKVLFDYFTHKNEFVSRECYIDSVSGEFVHFQNSEFVQSRGLGMLYDLSEEEIRFADALVIKPLMLNEISEVTGLPEEKIDRIARKLIEKGIAKSDSGKVALTAKIELPPGPNHELLSSLREVPVAEAEVLSREIEKFPASRIPKLIHSLWAKTVVRKIIPVYRPIYLAVLVSANGEKREIEVDGFTGRILKQ